MKSSYIPMTREQQEAMLAAVGVNSMEELFSAIPEELKLKKDLNIPDPLSEHELKKQMLTLVEQNFDSSWNLCFLGRYRTSSALTAEALGYIEENNASMSDAAKWFLKQHDELLTQWLSEDKAELVRARLGN